MSVRKVLSLENINENVLKAQYAVRGELAVRADELTKELQDPNHKHPFTTIVNCNIGNPQQLKQPPITFFRQVAALVEYPFLMEPQNIPLSSQLFASDAIDRAKAILASCGGSVGAYSHSQGIPKIREHVAEYLEERDGCSADPENIFLTAGASQGVQMILQTIVKTSDDGIMIPIPQYPLYTATLALCNGTPVPYMLNEANNWSLDLERLQEGLEAARAKNVNVKALCVINPGNPTGNCLTRENMEEIIQFCHKERLVLLADEVYQTNVYIDARPFHSFKSVLCSMGARYNDLEMFSFHSISKGVIGECGRRGGYFECTNIDPDVKKQIYKLASISLCPAVHGQILVDLMVRPPKPNDPSFALYQKEVKTIYDSLKRRALKLVESFNGLEGVTCNEAQGAMYAFPLIRLPRRAIAAAQKAGKQPDEFYCMALLNATGVCVIPGSGFGQEEGTFHFRSTFLPPEELFDGFCQRIATFHNDFMKQYGDR